MPIWSSRRAALVLWATGEIVCERRAAGRKRKIPSPVYSSTTGKEACHASSTQLGTKRIGRLDRLSGSTRYQRERPPDSADRRARDRSGQRHHWIGAQSPHLPADTINARPVLVRDQRPDARTRFGARAWVCGAWLSRRLHWRDRAQRRQLNFALASYAEPETRLSP